LVEAARSGQHDAFGQLVELWFDRCWDVAWRILRDRDLAADVAQDTLFTAWRQLDRLQRPTSFGGWVLRIARNRALDRLAQQRRAVPTADHATLEPSVSGNDPTGPEAAFARGQERDLVWAAAAALGERDASLLDLHLRHGLEPHELAEELDIAPNAAHQALFRLRKRLGAAIRAWLLWRGSAPACVVLRAELAAAGDTAFGAATVRVIERHARDCEACTEERERIAAPAMLFSAVPLLAPPMIIRARALRSLADAGVPVVDGAGGDAVGDAASAGGDGGAADAASAGRDATGAGPASGATLPVTPVQGPTTHAVAAGGDLHDGPPQEPSTRRRQLASTAVMVALLVLGGWAWWRAAGPFEPAVVGNTVETPSPAAPAAPAVPADAPTTDASTTDAPRELSDEPRAPVADGSTASPPTSDPSPPAPVDEMPVIAAFRAAFVGGCPTARMGQFDLLWVSEHAATATLTNADGTAESVPVSGRVRRCAPDGSVFTLEVTGPGGEATRTVEASAQRAPDDPGPEGPAEPEGSEGPLTPDALLVTPS
jgi:RNA polymerase sigma factor (sigma-70 family)